MKGPQPRKFLGFSRPFPGFFPVSRVLGFFEKNTKTVQNIEKGVPYPDFLSKCHQFCLNPITCHGYPTLIGTIYPNDPIYVDIVWIKA
jgi:hypothetical protein